MLSSASHDQNLIIASLPRDDRLRLVRYMQPVELDVREELIHAPQAEPGVYFPTSGLVSIVVTMADGSAVECAAVAAEGWVGVELFSGMIASGVVAFQQIAGSALRMDGATYAAALRESPAFARAVTRFSGLVMTHAVQTAACNRLHDATARCAKWLLFTSERVGRDDLPITQEFLGQMLGSSRTVVTATLAKLEKLQLIASARGRVAILDAHALRRHACECSSVLAQAYARYVTHLRDAG